MATTAQVTLTVLTVAVNTANGQDQFGLRLVGGGTDLAGRVEMFIDSEWGIVCDIDWRYADAAVVCRQLGFGGPIDALGPGQFGPGGTNVVLQNVACEGSESNLIDCPLRNYAYCNFNQNVGVICSNGTIQPVQYEVRLGFVNAAEVYFDGAWEAVCYDGWNNSDAQVVCRQVGYTGGAKATLVLVYGERMALFYDVECTGFESSFKECNWTIDNRNCSFDAGVECHGSYTHSPAEYSVQLVDDRSTADVLMTNTYLEGQVAVFIAGSWARLCYNEFTMAAATVICRQLGYGWPLSFIRSRSAATLQYKARLNCTGTENHLNECLVSAPHDCDPYKWADPILICSGIHSQQLVLRLVNSYGGYLYGDVEVYAGEEWWSICTNGWDLADANVVCRQLGIGEAVQTLNVYGCCRRKLFDHVSCSGSETNLLECPMSPNRKCSQDDAKARIFCSDVRLVGSDSEWSGTVEVYNNGQWGTVCGDGWNLRDAEVVCRQLGRLRGMGSYRATAYFTNARFGPGSGRVVMSDVSCMGTEVRLLDCLSDFYETECSHSKDAGVECASTRASIQDFDARLSDGPLASQGRLEFYFDDQWYTVCADGWDTAASLAVCRQLGYAGADAYNSSLSYGVGTGRPIGGVKCYGEENELSDCQVIWRGCATTKEASVKCSDQNYTYELGAVRFSGGLSETQGRVEVFYDGEWGTICDKGWSDKDADVVCRELGFDDYVGTAMNGGYFGLGDGPVFLSNVDCTGIETRLVYCNHDGWHQASCNHDQDAGVVCTRPAAPTVDEPGGLSTGAIIGICVAGVSALVGVLSIICFIRHRHSSSKRLQISAVSQAVSTTVYFNRDEDPPCGGCLPESHASVMLHSSDHPKVPACDPDYEDPPPATEQ